MHIKIKLLNIQNINAVFTRDRFAWGKCISTIKNVRQYNINVNLPRVNVFRVNTA